MWMNLAFCEGFIAKIKEGRGDHIKRGRRLPSLQHFRRKKLIWRKQRRLLKNSAATAKKILGNNV